MRHDLSIEGLAFGLHPVSMDDAQFIYDLRADPERSAHLHPLGDDVRAQEEWLRQYFERYGDYYFIVRRTDGTREGAVGIYNVTSGTAEWGRWVMRAGSLGAAEAALLTYRVGFGALGLEQMHCITVARNAQVVSFHDSCGLRRTMPARPKLELGGEELDVVQHELSREEWPATEVILQGRAAAAAGLLNR